MDASAFNHYYDSTVTKIAIGVFSVGIAAGMFFAWLI